MITEYRIKGSLGIGTGLLANVAGFLAANFHAPSAVVWSIALPAMALTGYGCINYARAKGHSPLLGALGFVPFFYLWVIGLVMVCLLPDLVPEEKPSEAQRAAHQSLRQKNRQGK